MEAERAAAAKKIDEVERKRVGDVEESQMRKKENAERGW